MTPQQAKELIDRSYKDLIEGKDYTVPEKLNLVNLLIQDLRVSHNFIVHMNGAPIKGCTLDPHTQEVIYHVG